MSRVKLDLKLPRHDVLTRAWESTKSRQAVPENRLRFEGFFAGLLKQFGGFFLGAH
jgi:uncharacterized protein YfbU (UPF0304 family)